MKTNKEKAQEYIINDIYLADDLTDEVEDIRYAFAYFEWAQEQFTFINSSVKTPSTTKCISLCEQWLSSSANKLVNLNIEKEQIQQIKLKFAKDYSADFDDYQRVSDDKDIWNDNIRKLWPSMVALSNALTAADFVVGSEEANNAPGGYQVIKSTKEWKQMLDLTSDAVYNLVIGFNDLIEKQMG